MEEVSQESAGATVTPPPKPPNDGGGLSSGPVQETTTPAEGNLVRDTVRNSNVDKVVISTDNDLHGDWITVTKSKKLGKNRAKIRNNKFPDSDDNKGKVDNGREPTNQGAGSNRFSRSQAFVALKSSTAPSNTPAHSSPKVRSLPGDIKTMLDVVMVSPNHMRFVDEPKPPDATSNNQSNVPHVEAADHAGSSDMEEVSDQEDVQDPQGHAGGLWALIPLHSNFSFQVVDVFPQAISVLVEAGASKWVCIGVYGCP
ncbi:LINE-1 reverse transcriptase isogeny, partial [Sesbania bispinosa]